MIQIKKEDNIYDILDKIKKIKTKNKRIILNFPIGHHVLYNIFALKSIKEFIGDKKLIIQTKDILSKKIGKKIGIKYNILGEEKTNINLIKMNYSFWEYLIYEIKKLYFKIFKKNKYIDPRKKFLKFYRQKNNLKIFIFLLFIAIFLFSYIFLFILNKTFVYITPNIKVNTKTLNFIITEQNLSKQNAIKTIKLEKTLKLEKTINSSGIKIAKQNRARGEVILKNFLTEDVKLLNNTRLQTKNGLLFETQNSVKIPKAIKNKLGTIIPGTVKVKVIAKTKDINGGVIGQNGNVVKNTKLILPGLNKNLQSKIFAISSKNFHGGKDKFEKIISKSDIENSEKIFKEYLKKEAIKSIKTELQEINKQKNSKYKIPNIDNIYQFSNIKINLGDIKEGDKKNSFKVSGEITIKTYAYDSNQVISKLKNEIEKHILEGKEKLINIDEQSLFSINKVGILYKSQNPFSIKLSLGVNYYVEYDFLDENDNYIKRLKQTILGLDKEKAENILINEERISNAKIKIRPFFMKKVSNYPSNIEFIIEK